MRKAGSTVSETRRSLAELEQQNREIGLLRQMSSLLHGALAAEEIYAVAAEFSRQLFPTESGAVCVLNRAQDLVEPATFWGQVTACERPFTPDECWALRLGRVHWVENVASHLVCLHLSRPAVAEYLCVPMMAQGEVLGIVHLQARSQERLAAAKQQLAVALAEHIALALANCKARETLAQQALRDPLTALFNRRYLEESLERELRRAVRNHRSLGVVMLDVDRFKGFNDRFGHQAGDALLRAWGNLLRQRTRAEDIACRYGGEEFALVMPESPLKVAVERVEHLREGVKQLRVPHGDELIGGLSLSAGVSAFPEHEKSPVGLLRVADAALYRAKNEGRDRVMVGEALG